MLKILHCIRWNVLLIVFLAILLSVNNIHAQSLRLTQRELSVVHLRSMEVLRGYENIINQIGQSVVRNPSTTKGLSEQFLELATSTAQLFNDLDPSYKLSPFYEPETYINNLILWYPDGITVDLNLDGVKVGDILSHGDNRYSLDFQLDKQLIGNYLNRQLNTKLETLQFRVGFTKSGNDFRNFKIVGIKSIDSGLDPNYNKSIDELDSQTMKQSENDAIKQGIESLINDYTNYLLLLGDDEETEYDKAFYTQSFKALFVSSDLFIFNDLIPNPDAGLIPLEEYLYSLRVHYPFGIESLSITLDSVIFNSVIPEGNEVYSTSIGIDKFFSGVYDNQENFRRMFPLTLKVSFQKKGRAFENFRIRSIELEEDDYFESDEGDSAPVQEIGSVTRKGISVVVFGSYGQTRVEDHNLMDMSLETDHYSWTTKPGYGVTLGAGIMASLSDHFALETGGFYNQYSTTFSMNGSFQDIKSSMDVNSDQFLKTMTVDYDSTVSYNLLSIPLSFTITSSKSGRTGVYITLGGLFSYCLSGDYETSGSWEYSGYYPEHPSFIRNVKIPELGYYKKEEIEEFGEIDGGQINLSVRASMGLTIPIKYFTQIRIGPEVEWGLYDFNKDGGEAHDIFGNPKVHQPTYLFRFGVRLGLVFKL